MGRATVAITSGAIGLIAAATVVATPAHADENSYLAMLNEHDAMQYVSTSEAISMGQYTCSQLRLGRSIDAVYSDLVDFLYGGGRIPAKSSAPGVFIGAAWRGLCPEQGPRFRNHQYTFIGVGQP